MRAKNSKSDRERERLDEAISANRRGQTTKAIRMLTALIARRPRFTAANGYLAGIYFQRRQFEDAEKLFRTTTCLNGKSELASLGLFHSLWNLGRYRDAFAEMRRFLTASESDEYNKMLREFIVSGELEPELEPIGA